MHGAEPPRIAGNGGAGGRERGLGLGDVNDPLAQAEMRAERVARPGHDRIPMARLTFDQSLRCRRAIANKIGGEILFESPPRPVRADR